MSSSDPSVNAVLAAAKDKIRATVDATVVDVANSLLMLMKSAGTYRERGQLAFAQIHILENRALRVLVASLLPLVLQVELVREAELKVMA